MKMRMARALVILGCLITIAGTVAAINFDSRLSEINKTLERSGPNYYSDTGQRVALEKERDGLASAVPASVAVAASGMALMGGVPLAIVVRRWRAGELDGPSKGAAVTFAVGSLLLILGTVSCLAVGARLAAVSKELDRLYDEGPTPGVEDWDDKFTLEWEKKQFQDKLTWFGATVVAGIALTVVPGAWAWRRAGARESIGRNQDGRNR